METPSNYKYAKEHEWVVSEGATVRLGISNYAQKELGDVVFVDLPAVGKKLQKGQSFMTVESVKAVSDIYSPVDGEVVAINDTLAGSPELVNQDPYGKGWIAVLKVDNASQLNELLDAKAYDAFTAELS